MVLNKEMMKEIAESTDCGVPSGASRHNDSPSAGSGSDSGSPSPVSTATHSDNEDVPNDLDLQEDEGQKGKGRKRMLGKEPRTRKKGQKFQCTGYGDCALTFTRSEHLSRHIRKHTGEKPYRCFCNRDFSRLDNLRQHAFTVHEPSEIPPGWEHAVKCQSKTARNTEGRRKEANVRRARKREVRAKRATTPETPPPASHPPVPKGVSGTPSQRNSYQEYPQGQLQHQQAPVLRQLPMHQPQPQLHHQQGFGHHQQVPVHHQASTPHQAPPHPQSALHHPPTVHRQQLSIHSQAPLHHQQPPVRRQQTPVQQHHAPPLPPQGYHPSPIRARPQSLILPSQAHHEPSFHGYRHTTPPQSPQSTPQTPRAGYNHGSDSILTTPTTANFHHHRNSLSSGPQTPAGGWNDANRRLSMPYGGGIEFGSVLNPSPRAPIARARRDPLEAEENRRKRMTWHGVEDTEISNIVSPLEHTHLDDPRPLRRPRASTYVPAAAPATMALPSVESLLNPVASTPRTIPLVPSALSPRAADRRPSSGRFEHSRSRSASHIQANPDPFTPLVTRATYQDSLADRLADARGQRRQAVINGSRFGSPEGPSQDANGIFREAMTFRHSRSDSTDSLAPPRPMEPSFGSAKPEFAPEKAKDNGFVFGERQPASHAVHITRPRAKTSAGANGEISGYVFPRKETPRMELLESEVFEHRPRREGPMNLGNLDYLATICKQRIEEEKPGLNRVGP